MSYFLKEYFILFQGILNTSLGNISYFLRVYFRYTDSMPNNINQNDIKPNEIKPNDI